jgi:gluconate 2-dehydrogenase gamma chain
MSLSTRRQLLVASSLIGIGAVAIQESHAATGMPWTANTAYPPEPILQGSWLFLTPKEAITLEAIADRLIPVDENGPGGKDAGCVVFIDRQMAGPFGVYDGWYMEGPFPADPLPSQGMQSPLVPRQRYRLGLVALSKYVQAEYKGQEFEQLSPADQDKILTGLQTAKIKLDGFDAKMLFDTIYANVIEGFFADPIYGGNKDMAGWKLVGFPGTRYDYRDVMANPNKPYTLPPVSIQGRPDWNRSQK